MKLPKSFGGLNKSGLHEVLCLNDWYPVRETVRRGLGVALLEVVVTGSGP